MKIHGSRTMDAPRAAVYAAICDPSTLLGVIPGCREIEKSGDTEYRGQISLRLPGIVGMYRTVVRLVDADAPCGSRLEGEVVGTPGALRGHAAFRLAEAGGRTTIDYDGQAVISGPLSRLDSRFVEGLAGSLISQGLGKLNSRLRAEASAGAASNSPQPSKETSA